MHRSEDLTYFLPAGYATNPAATVDARSGSRYWNEARLATSDRYQHAAYALAAGLARRWGVRTVVDLGCGVGTKLERFFGRDFEVFGIDQAPAVAECRRRFASGTFIAEDLDHPSYAILEHTPAIDLLICSDVIEHLEDPDVLLEYVHRIASPATRVILTTPDRHALLGSAALRPLNPAHVREWSRDEFAAYLRSRTFEIQLHRRLLPFRPGLDRMTAKFAMSRIRRRLSPFTNQLVVCRSRRSQGSTSGAAARSEEANRR